MCRGTCRSGTVACNSENWNDGVATKLHESPKNEPEARVGTVESVVIYVVGKKGFIETDHTAKSYEP